ncbi:DUF4872 domain-containing protein [Natronorubrum sp. JWXQ-INN-674]|uniref:DUF4872 domain-containing protein n=1 Tax=Natronorubrum halalkaliphilum TaxID=2691917 RepID=A0A6B0VRB9_9EURY|nr:BtrH N-terminal domain-containing protein [Natronorubrum halalkaliphilum]MXV64391.1 DUF4872 domain-containing protein [Natronorubrum halalkaliphilum]
MEATMNDYRHRTGRHCGSTALRNLALYYDWGYDEETCFGLAAGLGFTYFELPESPHRGFFGRPPRLEETFFETLGIAVDSREGDDWRTVRDRIRARVAGGDPVLVFTDIYHLDYFQTDTHFAPHSVLCVGVEDDEETVVLSDSEFDALQRVPFDRLHDAMSSNSVLPLRNRHLVVADPGPDRSLEAAAPEAIAEMARGMLASSGSDGPIGRDSGTASSSESAGESECVGTSDRKSEFGTQGIAGIRRFADELPTWVDFEDPQWSVRFAYQNVERRGTGGGAFRQLYADFLETVDDTVPELPDDAVSRMNAIATDWTAVGRSLEEASERSDPDRLRPALTDTAETIHDLADREERLYEDLLAALA